MTSGPVQYDRLCRTMENVEARGHPEYKYKVEERMNKWLPLSRPLAVLDAVLDELLQFAIVARQAVPWLL